MLGLTLVAVRDFREARVPASAQELAEFETDVLAGFVLARASAGLADGTALHGSKRHHTLSVLRSLFRHCKKTGTIFRDPATRIRIGRHDYAVVQPPQPAEVRAALAAAITPPTRLTLALAAIHAAHPKAIRELHLDDVDLGNRRMIIADHARPLDEYTRRAVLDWLDYRHTRWPKTANPHLILSQQSAMETGPVTARSGSPTPYAGTSHIA